MAKAETVTTYRWNEPNSIIRRIDVREQSNGMAVAYLYANPAPELQQERMNIRAAIRLKGWGTLSDHRDGDFSLRVSGLRSGADLITMLQNQGIVTAPARDLVQKADEEKPKSFADLVRANTLRGAGIFYSIGNAIYLTSGILRSKATGKVDTGQISSALLWGAGDALVATVGGRDDSRQLTSLLSKLKKHYTAEGIEIPATASIHVETSTKNKSFGTRIYDFLHEYVNPIKCASEVAAAFGYYKAGKDQGNVWKQRTAVTFGLGFLASLLIPEKKIDEEKYAQAGPVGKLWMWIQSNPLAIGGVSGYSNTIFTTFGAISERKAQRALGAAGNKIYRLDFAAPAVMFFGNSLYAVSKKTTGGDIKGDAIVSDAYTVAAQIINKQPEGLREKAIESTAKFFAERTEIKENHTQVIERLRKEVDIQRQNPWFEPKGLANYTPAPKPHKILRAADAHTTENAASKQADAAIASHQETPTSTIAQVGIEHKRDAVAAMHMANAATLA